MSIEEKSDGKPEPFVEEQFKANDDAYGEEMRERFGEEEYNRRYDAMKHLDKEGFIALNDGLDEIHRRMAECLQAGEAPGGDAAQTLVKEHRAYLGNYGDFYTDDVYYQLGQGYASDERFHKYYEGIAAGLADWLAKAIAIHCGR